MSTRHPSLKASTNPWSTTRDPQAVRRAVLDLLDEAPKWHTVTTARLNVELYGSSLVGASSLSSALGALKNLGLVEKVRRSEYRITPAGREHLRLSPVFESEGAS